MSESNENNESYVPSTVLVLLGPLHFEHAGSADVLSVKIAAPEETTQALEKASSMVQPSTVETLHVVLKSSAISSLFDERIFTTFFEGLKQGGETSVHVLGSAEMPVQPADVDEIRFSLIMAGLRLEQEGLTEGEEGGWALLARKPVIETVDEEEEDEDDEEEEETTPDDKVEKEP